MAFNGINGIDFDYQSEQNTDNTLVIPAIASYSEGEQMETSERFTTRSDRRPQTVARRKFLRAKTFTISYEICFYNSKNIIEDMWKLEDAVGQTGMLYHAKQKKQLVVVAGVSFVPSVDALGQIYKCGITLEIKAALQPAKRSEVVIRTF